MLFLLFLFGLAVGSFLNVVIDRLPQSESIVRGRSHCPKCGRILRWYDLLPLLSFVFLRGRCRYCGQKISWQYPLVELATGVLFVLSPPFILYSFILYSLFLIPIFVTDLKYGIIPSHIVFPAIALVTGYQLLVTGWGVWGLWGNLKKDASGLGPYLLQTDFFRRHVWLELRPLLWTLLGSLALYLLFSILHHLFSGRALGGGDVKLAFLVGLITGFPNMLVAVFSAFLTGALVSVMLILLHKKKFGETIPFGPFLVLGTYIALLFGESVIKWYLGLL